MLTVGQTFEDKYEVLTQIGRGGTSRVFLVYNKRSNRQWALKVIPKADNPELGANLIADVKILKGIRHPNIPAIVDVFDKDDAYYILMDYVEGVTLQDVINSRGAQPQELVVRWALKLCDVFKYLHGLPVPIIYRDTKPKNIMLRPNGDIALIDFGAAREYKPERANDTVNLGTRGYAAPEQFLSSAQTDARTDIFNLGATLYHLVTGHDPAHFPYEMRPIRAWDPALSSGLEQIILKCTMKEPQKRYQSMDELEGDLINYRLLDEEAQKRRRRRNVWTAVLAGLSLCCGLGFFCFYSEARKTRTEQYEAMLRAAKTATTLEAGKEAYMEAIRTAPGRYEGYEGLIDRVYLADESFRAAEAEELAGLLSERPGRIDTRSIEARLKEEEESYARFCFKLGLTYFYYYEDSGNRPMAEPWLSQAAGGPLTQPQKLRCTVLARIASYYAELSIRNRAGDSLAGFSDYFRDISALLKTDIAEEDNTTTALVIYADLAYELAMHLPEFEKAGIGTQELADVVRALREYLDALPEADKETARYRQTMENLVLAEGETGKGAAGV